MVIFSGYAQPQWRKIPTPEPEPALIGGNRDENGCLLGAGYSWCELKQKCLRIWDEPCDGEKRRLNLEVIVKVTVIVFLVLVILMNVTANAMSCT